MALDRSLVDGYLRHLGIERRLSPHTATNYARDLRALAEFAERGNLDDWQRIDSQHVRMFAARSHAGGLSPRSVQRRLSATRGFFNYLVRAPTALTALASLEASLREDFDAFQSVLLLTAPIASLATAELEPFLRKLPADDANIRSFEALLATGKPRCGQVRDTQRDFLFGPESASIGSVALVPLGDNGTVGLLALGSAERERFHPGMSTEFLKRMGELITDALNRP